LNPPNQPSPPSGFSPQETPNSFETGEHSFADLRYSVEPALSSEEFIDCLVRSTLAERRPIESPETIRGMLQNASILLTARWKDGLLVGVARSLSDFHYCTYLSDLAVDINYQRRGIGKELIRRTHEAAGKQTMLILLSAPKAVEYYPHIGMQQHPSAWYFPRPS
jgi:GNAT superfamily N-acetyltransferase